MTGTTMEKLAAIERTLELKQSPEQVWRAITDPSELQQWFPDSAEIDLRAGGEGWFTWTEGRFRIRVETVDPPRYLAWRWGWEPVEGGPENEAKQDGDSQLVEWTLTPRADGGTTLFLRESGFRRAEQRAENDQGWTSELAELVAYLDLSHRPDPR